MNIQNSIEFTDFVTDIKNKILSSQYEALKKVNKELINLYWDIGQDIVSKQEAYGWGKSVVKNLSQELQKEFVGMRGFSQRNLWNMRNFYIEYKDNPKLQSLTAEIGWTYRVLSHQIENKNYEKYLLNQTNFNETLPSKYKKQAKLAVKDEYNFDFLELSSDHSEYELEIGLINSIREFLSQMGTDFAFIGNQYRLEVDNEEYFIDLLLYHRRLKSLIAIELKVGIFKPEFVGKMSFYLSILNDTIKLADENPSIGIIICKEKNRIVVEYTLKDTTQSIGIATYKTMNELPDNLQEYLPTTSEIKDSVMECLRILDAK